MVFSAPTFLFLFLPVVVVCAHLAPRPLRNTVLLLASLFFYAWGEGEFVLLMLSSIAFNFVAGRVIGSEVMRSRPGLSGSALGLAIAGNLALLAWFKYAGFFAEVIRPVIGTIGGGLASTGALDAIHLPIGISFFTFQAISYLIDVRRGETAAQKSPIDLALFIALFPQLIAGPIVRYKDLEGQLAARRVRLDECAEGVRRFTIGLSKKVLVANPLGLPADAIFALPAAELTPSVAWFGLLCYSLQIYFDFSGYSDMAIGIGRLLGFRLPENFAAPYRSSSITEFWRRWHMSLSTWFRDYLYIPLGGNRKGLVRTYANLMFVFLLCGLWHGASLNFVVWGLVHGAFLILERMPPGKLIQRLPTPLAHAYCLLAVAFAWVFFRADTLPAALAYLSALAGVTPGESVGLPAASFIVDFASLEALLVTLVALGWIALEDEPLTLRFESSFDRVSQALVRGGNGGLIGVARTLTLAMPTAAMAGLWLLCGMKLASRTYDPFLYFRF